MMRARFLGTLALLGLTAGGLVVGMAQSANAVGGNCSSTRQEKEDWGPNSFRVRAVCSSLQANTKARGTLDVALNNDKSTIWFTGLNKYYYSGYTDCGPSFSCTNTRIELAQV